MTDAVVLIVDDEVGFVETMSKRLEKRNMVVYQAFDGDGAMNQLAAHSDIQVVILDMKMPGKDGIVVLQEIKETYPLVEVIMLTGHATVPSAVEGMQHGAFDYLMKPCSFDELNQKIREARSLKEEHDEEVVEARINDISGRMA
ncbi:MULTISPECIES: response regulator [unclassified Pseudodesulfovibrio]|uniref:response regulator n=1 Tax=unclassified Pseudodesulfovibrio TaxID=2661612 RepID=UPI000FEB9B24|nr:MULTISPECIES: response regulator [unclassified Pseudodesulfovibrio]MCJ2163275.1 response regulator [Pseudodesulfovibrio sp. S3-i]RWU07256.1 response regulator [Pseudodesulfovibrio sp. S3]